MSQSTPARETVFRIAECGMDADDRGLVNCPICMQSHRTLKPACKSSPLLGIAIFCFEVGESDDHFLQLEVCHHVLLSSFCRSQRSPHFVRDTLRPKRRRKEHVFFSLRKPGPPSVRGWRLAFERGPATRQTGSSPTMYRSDSMALLHSHLKTVEKNEAKTRQSERRGHTDM